jgi:hypothetical protein
MQLLFFAGHVIFVSITTVGCFLRLTPDIDVLYKGTVTVIQMQYALWLPISFWGRGNGVVVVIVWLLDLQLPMQSVHLMTNVVSANPTQVRCTQ